MKKLINIIFALGLILQISSCEKLKLGDYFLEKAPGVDVTIDTIFSNREFAERFLWGGYATLPYGVTPNIVNLDYLESLTDIVQTQPTSGANILYYDGQASAEKENINQGKYMFYNAESWDGIRIGYIFIKNISNVPDLEPEYRNQLIAEARMIIAMHYSIMYRHYGGLPWIDHAMEVNENTFLPRLTSRATLDSIVNLIDKSIPDLPWVISDLSNWEGRFTQAGAMGLKARILLFGASPLFNSDIPYLDGEAAQEKLVWHGSYDADLWQKAADAAGALISKVETEGGYAIIKTGNPRQDFQDAYFPRGKSENLIDTRTVYQNPNNSDDYGIIWYQGACTYTQEYVDMFPMSNGIPITDPASGYDPANPYKNRDPRLYETVLVNGDYFQGRTAELWIGGRERINMADRPTGTGYGPRKFLLEQNTATNRGAVVHWPFLRLAEIYLSYAEALNEINNGPTSEAYRCVNLIRNRVYLNNLDPGLTKEEFREAVLNERACEFGMEEVRWFDLIRWKRKDDFIKPLHGMNITKSGSVLTYSLFELRERYWKINWSAKWYLSAFPSNEINKKWGLIQNPGWE